MPEPRIYRKMSAYRRVPPIRLPLIAPPSLRIALCRQRWWSRLVTGGIVQRNRDERARLPLPRDLCDARDAIMRNARPRAPRNVGRYNESDLPSVPANERALLYGLRHPGSPIIEHSCRSVATGIIRKRAATSRNKTNRRNSVRDRTLFAIRVHALHISIRTKILCNTSINLLDGSSFRYRRAGLLTSVTSTLSRLPAFAHRSLMHLCVRRTE